MFTAYFDKRYENACIHIFYQNMQCNHVKIHQLLPEVEKHRNSIENEANTHRKQKEELPATQPASY
jgi:hypothetical protein